MIASDAPKFKSLVDHLRAVQNSTRNDSNHDNSKSDIDAICEKNASEASKKLLTQLKTMDKGGVKDLINNPKQPYKKKVLNIQAREKLREQMRKKLKRLGDECDSGDYQFEPDECIDYEKIPESLIAQIGKTIDMNLDVDDMDLSESINEDNNEDRDIEVVTKNLGNDFLMGSEILLMNGFSLLAETEQDTEVAIRRFEDSDLRLPPLPAESQSKPPSPPPEPVPPPIKLHEEKAVYSSLEKPWSPIRNKRPVITEDDWDIESAKNPDPPNLTISKELVKDTSALPPTPIPVPVVQTPCAIISESPSVLIEKPLPLIVNVAKEEVKDDERDIATTSKPSEEKRSEPPVESSQRAGETYGDYRRRLAAERESKNGEMIDNMPANDFNRMKENDLRGGGSNNRNDNWNNRRKNQNDARKDQNYSNQQNRKSRFEMNRGRDRPQNNLRFQPRNSSRDTNHAHESGRTFDDVKDVHNYRFQHEKKNSQEPDIDRLNTILHPKPIQFKGSFNKRSQNTNNYNNHRSTSRNRTSVTNSVERDFDENLLPSENDVRPCLSTLKKVMEIDAEMTRVHDKVHGIDKVISNLQLERVGYQKKITQLQHDRKVLFENLMKRAVSNADADKHEAQAHEKEPSVGPSPTTSQKSVIEKKLQNIVDQKKRKHEEQTEEPKKKKPTVEVMETTSAADKAAQLRKEKEEEERRQQSIEKKRLKMLRKERQRADQVRLEEKIRQEAAVNTVTTVKQEIKEKSVERVKSHKQQQQQQKQSEKSQKSNELKELTTILFKQNEILQLENFKDKKFSLQLKKVLLSQNLVDLFTSNGSLEIEIDDWKKWSLPEQNGKEKIKEEEKVKLESPEIFEDPLAIPETMVDPLAVDEEIIKPPTPGTNLTVDDSMLIELPSEQDYTVWTGNFSAHEDPIVHLQNVVGKFIVCASEGGKVYKYHLKDGKLAAVFSKHTEICNSFLYDHPGSLYTVSSDGFLHKIKFKVKFHIFPSYSVQFMRKSF